jgi:hypothetical protein
VNSLPSGGTAEVEPVREDQRRALKKHGPRWALEILRLRYSTFLCTNLHTLGSMLGQKVRQPPMGEYVLSGNTTASELFNGRTLSQDAGLVVPHLRGGMRQVDLG